MAAAPSEVLGRGVPAEPVGLRALQMELLAEHDLLDVPDHDELDAVARLARALSGYPVAMVNALQATRTCQLSHVGVEALEMDRDDSLCHRASLVGGVVVSGDCTTDPLFADLAWVDGRLGSVRRYAMAPLVLDGTTFGSLCVLDEAPGDALPEDRQQQLADLAAVTVALVQRRRDHRRTAAALEDLATAHAELFRARAFKRALVDALPVGVIAVDTVNDAVVVNSTARAWHGAAPGQGLSNEGFADHVYDADGTTPLPVERLPLARVLEEGCLSAAEVVIRAPGLAPRTVQATGAAVLDEVTGEQVGAVMALLDVTAQRALEAQLRQAATHDVLTGLPGRALLVQRLEEALADGATAAAAGEPVAVLYCDLDDFKAVNDTCGHAAGDAVLREVAARLSAVLRPGDTAARLGGDEFVLVCPGVLDDAATQALVARVTAATGRPVEVDGVEHRVGVSVGAVTSTAGSTAEGMLSSADAAMYAAKRSRRERRARHAAARS